VKARWLRSPHGTFSLLRMPVTCRLRQPSRGFCQIGGIRHMNCAPLQMFEQQSESCSQYPPLGTQDGLAPACACDAVSAAITGAT
ncbi:MAG: hypothetical protein KKI02_08720, partial [Planctomycetes bacterium]|nr:hypothetical protein [Planctomycetota bacterium]